MKTKEDSIKNLKEKYFTLSNNAKGEPYLFFDYEKCDFEKLSKFFSHAIDATEARVREEMREKIGKYKQNHLGNFPFPTVQEEVVGDILNLLK